MTDLSNVFDFFCPSPPSLKNLVSMKIAMDLWCREIRQHITKKGTLRERHPSKKTSLRFLTTDLRIPATIVPKIEYYMDALMTNIPDWLSYHTAAGIFKLDVLNHFLDFACDFDGTIHYERTAKRFVACEGIDEFVKFKMACEYYLEDEIIRIWPAVSSRMELYHIGFDRNQNLLYWACRLRNTLYHIREIYRDFTSSIEELFLRELYAGGDLDSRKWPSVKYFLNRLLRNSEMKNVTKILNLFQTYPANNIKEPFFRYILPKLNQTELKELVNENGDKLISSSKPQFVLRIWAYIKNDMTSDGFCRLFKHILTDQTANEAEKDLTPHWRELWTSTPDRLKQAAIRALLSIENSCLVREQYDGLFVGSDVDRRSVSFLLAVLSDTPIEKRITFWNKYWEHLTCCIKTDDFRLLLNLCFNNDQIQIAGCKRDLMSKYLHKVQPHLEFLFRRGCLKELEEFLAFCSPTKDIVRRIRLKLLRLPDSSFRNSELILEGNLLAEFIDNAYENPVIATEFKNKLLTTSDSFVIENLKYSLFMCGFRSVMDFLDTFAPSAEIALQVKKHELVPALKEQFSGPRFFRENLRDKFDEFEVFLGWLFETTDEIEQFKEALDMDAFMEVLIQDKMGFYRSFKEHDVDYDWFYHSFRIDADSDSVLKKFLKWYFVTPEIVENFEKKYRKNRMFNRLYLI